MTDLEMTRLCAEAMGYEARVEPVWTGEPSIRIKFRVETGGGYDVWCGFDPLHDDAQAMAPVKKFHLELTCGLNDVWIASNRGTTDYISGNSTDINRAIVECVANMQKACTLSAHPSSESTDSV